MNNRCNRPKAKAYENYGGRGVRVCERWLEGSQGAFERFLEDLGSAPSAEHSIDRIDVNGHYEPGNCRWSTRHTQMRNMRKNRYLTAFGKTQVMADWAREYGIHSSVIRYRIDKKGMTIEEAVTTLVMPVGYNGKGRT